MKKHCLFLLFLFVSVTFFAQKKNAELEDYISKGTFTPESIPGLRSMNDGIHYTVLECGTKIVKYAYETGKEAGVIVDLKEMRNTSPIESFNNYVFSPDESKILVYVNRENIYRRSFKADYYVIDVERREIEALSNAGKQQLATFSPDGNNVAYVRDNNIFIKKLRFDTENAITTDGAENTVINGTPDWVYEEEFGLSRAFEWSPNSEELAYIRFDESDVKEYSFPLYKASYPEMEEFALYPGQHHYKYPKAGENNSKVSVHVFNLRNRTTKQMDAGDDAGIYIPRIYWTHLQGQLAIVKMNRRQNQLELYFTNSASGVGKVIFTDRNDRYIAEDVLNNLYFLGDGKHFVYVGEFDGYNHIHLFGVDGRKIRQVTKGKWDVTDFYGFDEKKNLFYFQAAATSPLKREVYSIKMDGTKQTKLLPSDGTNNAIFSNTFSYFINTFSNASTPPQYTVHNSTGKQLRVIEDNAALKSRLAEYNIPAREFFTFATSDGIELNGWMIKPAGFNAATKYPVFMTQYSGPESQQALDRWETGWEQYLAANGYLVVCVDGRGTNARGEEFRKCTYMKLGWLESDDQIETAKYLGSLPYVDARRIAIWGWSYGGFMSALCLSRSDVFKVGIAIAPVTNWRFYDSVYTERFMRQPQENGAGYDQNSPIQLAENLTGRLFLIHSTADDNVHIQNTYEYADRLVQAGKQFDMFIYPNRNHSIYGGNVRLHLYRMLFDYLEKNL
ncbi:MAG: S9 family peptidase [Cytophagaceae bacterium]|jgi:dipeptidyl-peptidase-4|nr:S9 family peptidase [Cytophagaceae bacterium]